MTRRRVGSQSLTVLEWFPSRGERRGGARGVPDAVQENYFASSLAQRLRSAEPAPPEGVRGVKAKV